jgi:phosphopantetheine adenylyltransferase
VVLVSCGSFNPPTIAHLRMFDLATHVLAEVRVQQRPNARGGCGTHSRKHMRAGHHLCQSMRAADWKMFWSLCLTYVHNQQSLFCTATQARKPPKSQHAALHQALLLQQLLITCTER